MDTEKRTREIFAQYEGGVAYKNGLGKRGLYQQNRLNERFYAGDQWHGAHCGDARPLVRHNLIKRIGDYKMAMLGSSPVSVQYSADGVASTVAMAEEPADAAKATVITKLWKEWNEEGTAYTVKGITVCRGAVIRPEWELGLRLYPLAVFRWENRASCAYGESEVTYLIPNQIAVNRMLTASVWAVMNMGMPIMVVNGDVVNGPVTNDPGQVLKVYGGSEDVARAVRYVDPPAFSAGLDRTITELIDNTLTQSGANDAALGDVVPHNTSAILAVREAASLPMQLLKNRYYAFYEELARIWAEFWVRQYGTRALKIQDESGVWYLPFDGRRYEELLIRVQVDVGASTIWSENQCVTTLDNLLDRGVLSVSQYLKRLPRGLVPDLDGLRREVDAEISAAAENSGDRSQEVL